MRGLHTLSSEKPPLHSSKPCLCSLVLHVWPLVLRVPTRSFNPVACTANTRSVFLKRKLRFPGKEVDKRILQHIPFDYDKKAPLAIKTFLYLSTGFAIPFVASYYQL